MLIEIARQEIEVLAIVSDWHVDLLKKNSTRTLGSKVDT